MAIPGMRTQAATSAPNVWVFHVEPTRADPGACDSAFSRGRRLASKKARYGSSSNWPPSFARDCPRPSLLSICNNMKCRCAPCPPLLGAGTVPDPAHTIVPVAHRSAPIANCSVLFCRARHSALIIFHELVHFVMLRLACRLRGCGRLCRRPQTRQCPRRRNRTRSGSWSAARCSRGKHCRKPPAIR
jgi:hypothetical protein